MNLSGILVMTAPETIPACIQSLESLPGVEVHQKDDSGRIVVVQEAGDINAEVEGLKAIKALPEVAAAEMVYHYLADDHEIIESIPEDLMDSDQPEICQIPEFLND